jgi:hypothetical protein
MINKARSNLEDDVCRDIDSNPKMFWKYVSSKRKTQERIPNLVNANGTKTTTDHQKSEVLAEAFSSVFTLEPSGELPVFDVTRSSTAMPDLIINPEEVTTRLKALKPGKSAGPDGLHPRLLRETAEEISTQLARIYNLSLEEECLPTVWKTARVSAFPKPGDRSKPENYRPISLTAIACKTLEAIVRDNIMQHTLSQNLFTKKQFGFIPGRSTVLQLLQVLEKWTSAIEEGQDLDIVYLDFRKAFDKVPHRRLILKLKKYNLSPQIIKWIENFLNVPSMLWSMARAHLQKRQQAGYRRDQCWAQLFSRFMLTNSRKSSAPKYTFSLMTRKCSDPCQPSKTTKSCKKILTKFTNGRKPGYSP